MPDTFNTESKILIRSQWSKKIIKYINKRLNSKLVYLGLPSPEAEDIMEWIEYIDEIVAFQCRKYPEPSNASQSTEEVEKLQNKLSELERKKIISNFIVYDGYIEEVLLNGKDNAGIKFELNNLIHIFNLDFCNSITSPMEIVNKNGDIEEVYKFDAVKILLQLQDLIKVNPKKFVMFLTVKASYDGKELENFNKTDAYHTEISKLTKSEKRTRFLRLYIIKTLKNYFEYNGFIPEFLPVIEYLGVNEHKLLHFTIIGIAKTEKTGSAPSFQDFSKLIHQKFITIVNSEFKIKEIKEINEFDIETDPVRSLANSKSFKKLWQN